jgi:hypothetical protein
MGRLANETLAGENLEDRRNLIGPRPITSLGTPNELHPRKVSSRTPGKDAEMARISADWALLRTDPSFTGISRFEGP